MGRQWLSNRLVVVQHANLLPDELDHPDSAGIGLGTRSTNIPIGADRHQRISGDDPYTVLGLCHRQLLGEVRTSGDRNVTTFPDMVVLLWLHAQAIKAFLLKLSREPRVITPVGLDNDSARRNFGTTEHQVNRISLSASVPAGPDL